MLPFDGEGHSWRFSDVCRVTQLWLKAFSSGKIKEVWWGLLGGHRDTCSPGAVATTDQCRSRLNTNLYNLTGFETEETEALHRLPQIAIMSIPALVSVSDRY